MANSHPIQVDLHKPRAGISTRGHIVVKDGTLAPSNSTGTSASGAVTLNDCAGVITSESLTTAAAGTWTLTITNSRVVAGDIVMASVELGSATAGLPQVCTVTPGAGSITIVVRNAHASNAFNGTLRVRFIVFKV